MKRHITTALNQWKIDKNRKPLILRGARQVGKSYSVKEFGKNEFKQFIRIDFLLQKDAHLIFSKEKSLDPKRILKDLSFILNVEINPDGALLFLMKFKNVPGRSLH